MILVPDYIDDNWVHDNGGIGWTDFYGFCGFPYKSMYLGFLWIFQINNPNNDGPIFVELVSSHDGVNWRRLHARQPILSPGCEHGAWDGGMVFTSNHPLVEGRAIKLYYGGTKLTHGHEENSRAIGFATLRKDGFVSLDATGSAGSVLTRKCLRMTGPLRVNYKTHHDGGSLRAEVLDASGNVVQGYSKDACHELKGDSVNEVVRWKHHTELPEKDHPLQIRFVVQDASLYSFAAGDNVKVLSSHSGVLFTFEGDSGKRTVRNNLSDGEQDGLLRNNVRVVNDNAKFGASALHFDGNGSLNVLEIPGTTNLGDTFTLSAMVKMTNTWRTRIFSSYSGVRPQHDGIVAAPYEVIFDVDPSSARPLRSVINSTSIEFGSRYDHARLPPFRHDVRQRLCEAVFRRHGGW